MLERLKSIYKRQQFQPAWWAIFINPFFLARRRLFERIRLLSNQMMGNVLDVGCGTAPYRDLFAVQNYVGLDIDSPEARARGVADLYYDGRVFPLEAERFGSVLCNQVLEHVFNPDEFLQEIARVLQPHGRLLLTVPFVWDEHEQPWDYARYSSFGLRSVLERNGFKLIEQHKLLDDASILFQLAILYCLKVVRPRGAVPTLVFSIFVSAPLSIFGLAIGKLLPRNPDLFLDQVVLAERS